MHYLVIAVSALPLLFVMRRFVYARRNALAHLRPGVSVHEILSSVTRLNDILALENYTPEGQEFVRQMRNCLWFGVVAGWLIFMVAVL